VCVMKIVSWNVRGLDRLDKRKEVCKLVREKNPHIVCLQETKLQVCDDFLCSSAWGSSPLGYSYRPSVGASGGLLTLWDT
jgi:exonuclease III